MYNIYIYIYVYDYIYIYIGLCFNLLKQFLFSGRHPFCQEQQLENTKTPMRP